MDDCVINSRRRTVAAGAMRHQTESARYFLRGADCYILHLAVLLLNSAAFVQRVLAGDIVPVLIHHEAYAHIGAALFTGLS